MQVAVYTDGGARGNPGPAAAGVVIVASQKEYELGYYLGEKTNNQAEYLALIAALEHLGQHEELKSADAVIFHLDSELVVKQLNRQYRVKDPILQELERQVHNLAKTLLMVKFNHIPRKENRRADAIVNHVLDHQAKLGNSRA